MWLPVPSKWYAQNTVNGYPKRSNYLVAFFYVMSAGSRQDVARNVIIRRATSEDATAVAHVLRAAFSEFEPLYTAQGFAATTPGRDSVIERMQEGPTWVAVLDGLIAGTASAVCQQEQGVYVRGMAVLPEVRGQGIAQSLLLEIESFARQMGCGRLFLSTTPFLYAAIRLYQRCGYAHTAGSNGDLFGTPLLTMAKNLSQ
jgi:GNAT superfamily N-acetyltransferase